MLSIHSQRVIIFITIFFLTTLSRNFAQNCLVDTLVINTGYNPQTGTSISVFQNDPYWVVISDPRPGTLEPRPATTIIKHPAWSGPYPKSQWIAVDSSYSNNTNGIYKYQRCFCIAQGGRIRIKLDVLADDTVSILLNGNYIMGSLQAGFGGQFTNPLHIDTILYVNQGLNCLTFVVGNIGSVAHGLNVSGMLLPLATQSNIISDTCCQHPGFFYGQKFNDLNCNGKSDYGEPVLQNWGIVFQGIQGQNFTDTVFTGSDGYYSIQVPPGCYNVYEIPQSGWTQTYPSGIQQVCIHSGQVVTINFLNCQKPPCDTIGTIELDSSCCQFKLPIFNLAAGNLQQISWQILNNSGTMESILVLSSCSYSLSPPNPYNTISGNINFTGSGCNSNPTLIMEANPSTASGIVTIAFTFTHKGQKCYDTINLHCARAPLIKCDSISISPFTWPGLNLSGRTFKIFNNKKPISPIKEIKIKLVPDPFPSDPNAKWNGGGLFVDGSPRSWGVPNSGIPYYSLISLDCEPNIPPNFPQGNASNNYVQFNLGVDYTLGWTGNAIFTIIHCDGDTCELTYNNWCAKPPKQCITINPIPIDTLQFPKNLIGGTSKFNMKASKVRYIAIELSEESLNNAQIIGAIAGILDAQNNIVATATTKEFVSESLGRKGKNFAILELSDALIEQSQNKDCRIIAFFLGDSLVKYNVILFDEFSNPIGFQSFTASKPISSVKFIEDNSNESELLWVNPNPAKDIIKIEFIQPIQGKATIQILDILGNKVKTIDLGWKDIGIHSANLELGDISSGSYLITIILPNGKALHKSLIITK
ncbi:MAG: hypothetical protein N2560_02380 [Ignavibacteria bacterium]|nr:hypothetical protein [Ignavibacteria bacterium]